MNLSEIIKGGKTMFELINIYVRPIVYIFSTLVFLDWIWDGIKALRRIKRRKQLDKK